MQRVLRQLRRRGVDVGSLDALEVFGYTGELHTKEYAPLVRSLEVWEIDPANEAALRRNLPGATIGIVDSYGRIERTAARYGLVVVDNPMSTFGDGHCEHFDLLPSVFRVLASPAVVVLNVIPKLDARGRRRWPHVFGPEHLERRRAFYGTETPEDVPLEALERRYRALAAEHGLAVDWAFFVRRHAVQYLVLGLSRARDRRAPGEVRFAWRGEASDGELVTLTESYGGRSEAGWWDRIRPHSLGWVSARVDDGTLIGFVNVAWDGGDHAFLIDTKVHPDHRRRGIGTELVRIAARHAKDAGCEWLEVDFGEHLAPFYFDACGFVPTPAGLLHLPDLRPAERS